MHLNTVTCLYAAQDLKRSFDLFLGLQHFCLGSGLRISGFRSYSESGSGAIARYLDPGCLFAQLPGHGLWCEQGHITLFLPPFN